MSYLQLSLRYDYAAAKLDLSAEDLSDWLVAELSALAYDSFEQQESQLLAYIPQEAFDEAALQELLANFPLQGLHFTYSYEAMPDINWNEEWEKNYFQPIVLGEDACLIRAPFHAARPEIGLEVIINPKMAFGTGNHETTALVGSWLLAHSPLTGLRVLDMGCGTGILGLIALRLGAAHLVAIDIDPWAYDNVSENAALNGLHIDRIACGDASLLAAEEPVDLLLANITRNVLHEDMPAYVQALRAGGRLILSGFYSEDIPLLQGRAEALGLRYVAHELRNNWALLELEKPQA